MRRFAEGRVFLLAGANACMCAALCSCAHGALVRGVVDPRPLARPWCGGGVCLGRWCVRLAAVRLRVPCASYAVTVRVVALLSCFVLLSVWAVKAFLSVARPTCSLR